ncbi:MAG: electron transfer flavoprotein subunit alpha/FixB family protein [Angelakisella sp.]
MKGIFVWLQLRPNGTLHPVSLELLGKARELAAPLGWPVWAGAAGSSLGGVAQQLAGCGVARLYVIDSPKLALFYSDLYIHSAVALLEACCPAVALFGATPEGRSIAPAVAVHFGTGLTADCTQLELTSKGELVQVRPAFGGDIMAQIITPHTYPQMATVRPQVMKPIQPLGNAVPPITDLTEKLVDVHSRFTILKTQPHTRPEGIARSKVLVAIGKGVASKSDIPMFAKLAELLGGRLASSRGLVEKGWMPPESQIGLSGSSVRPRLLLTCGISGSVQFMAGASGAQHLCAINSDVNARILTAAHTPVLGDIYELVPRMIAELEKSAGQ